MSVACQYPAAAWSDDRAERIRAVSTTESGAHPAAPRQIQATTGDSGAPLRHDKAQLGRLLHAAEIEGKGEWRDGTALHVLQPTPCAEDFWDRRAVGGLEKQENGYFWPVACRGVCLRATHLSACEVSVAAGGFSTPFCCFVCVMGDGDFSQAAFCENE